MINRICDYIDKNRETMLRLIGRLVRIPSVAGEPSDGAPFGEKCAEAVREAERILTELGFDTHNIENAVVYGDIGEGEPCLGILAHLDVVPQGGGWSFPPFEMTESGGRIYGRGVIDDKGPAVAAIIAAIAAKNSGAHFKRGLRIILGSNEENGSSDLDYYNRREKMPPMLFTPDGSFPVINIEKGRLAAKFSRRLHGEYLISLTAGEAYNAVPDRAVCVLKNFTPQPAEFDGVSFELKRRGDETVITAVGKSAHASTPADGRNALTALCAYLAKALPESEEKRIFNELTDRFPFGETDGGGMGISCSDEKSGALTAVWSVAEYSSDTFTGRLDCRFPISCRLEDIAAGIAAALSGFNMEYSGVEGHYVDDDGDFVRTLLEAYRNHTGEEGGCIAIGGGTYVHGTDGGVAFGAVFDGDENNMHGADENAETDKLVLAAKIYAEAIYRLCCV